MIPSSSIAIDPGKGGHNGGLGWSAWEKVDLLSAGLARVKGRLELGHRALELASQIPSGAEEATVEQMFHYPTHGRRDTIQRADRVANDLLDLQAIGGIVAAKCTTGAITYVTAHGWKGEIPKDVVILRVWKLLTPEEKRTLEACLRGIPESLHHNVLEAVGLGLWRLRRWKR